MELCRFPPKAFNAYLVASGPSRRELDVKDLSRDQAYFYKIIKAIQFGVIDKTLLR